MLFMSVQVILGYSYLSKDNGLITEENNKIKIKNNDEKMELNFCISSYTYFYIVTTGWSYNKN